MPCPQSRKQWHASWQLEDLAAGRSGSCLDSVYAIFASASILHHSALSHHHHHLLLLHQHSLLVITYSPWASVKMAGCNTKHDNLQDHPLRLSSHSLASIIFDGLCANLGPVSSSFCSPTARRRLRRKSIPVSDPRPFSGQLETHLLLHRHVQHFRLSPKEGRPHSGQPALGAPQGAPQRLHGRVQE